MTVPAANADGVLPEPPPTLRRRKRELLRARVEHVALDLFRREGFEAVTVERIAAEAGIGATTFYRYFATKDGVVFGYQARWLQDAREAVGQVDVDRPRAEQLTRLLGLVLENFEAELDTMRMRDEIVAGNPALLPRTLAVQRAWEQEVARSLAQRRGVGPGDLTAQADAALVQLLVRLSFRSWRAGAHPDMTTAMTALLQDLGALTTQSASPGV